MGRKMFWLAAYILTGLGMMAVAIINNGDAMKTVILAIAALFYFISLNGHFKELRE